MRPERDIRACDVSERDRQALVPVIQLLIIRGLKARARQPEDLDVVSRLRPNHMLGEVRNIGYLA